MSHMFDNWPTISYDLDKKGKPLQLTNITLRYKVYELLSSKYAVVYEYDVVDGEKADIIAYKYYEDATLDWIIYLTNNIIDPQFDWPMDSQSFNRYVRAKYGSPEAAKQQIHHYEKILRPQQIFSDGSVIARKVVIVDKDTYDLTSPTLREQVDNHTYEHRLNQQRSRIKILDKRYVRDLTSTYEKLIKQSRG